MPNNNSNIQSFSRLFDYLFDTRAMYLKQGMSYYELSTKIFFFFFFLFKQNNKDKNGWPLKSQNGL